MNHTIRTAPKSNRKIVERGIKSTYPTMLLKGGTYEGVNGRKLRVSREYTEDSIYWTGSEHFALQRAYNDHLQQVIGR